MKSRTKVLKTKVQDIAKNTASTAEFIAETIKAESRYFKNLALSKVTSRLTGYTHKSQRDVSLEPLAGVHHQD